MQHLSTIIDCITTNLPWIHATYFVHRATNILSLDEKTSVVNQTFIEYSSALAKAEQERIKLESEYDSIKNSPNNARQVLENKTIQAYKEQRAKLDADYQDNAKIYKDNFPKIGLPDKSRKDIVYYIGKLKKWQA